MEQNCPRLTGGPLSHRDRLRIVNLQHERTICRTACDRRGDVDVTRSIQSHVENLDISLFAAWTKVSRKKKPGYRRIELRDEPSVVGGFL